MIRCNDGHFYDPAKHTSCPWCTKPLDISAVAVTPAAEGKTRPLQPADAPSAPVAAASVPARPANAGRGVTRRLDAQPTGIDPVVGWLVCIDGPEKGRDYRLHSERNFLGRSSSMDICIPGDESVSREKHAVITFEPKKRVFWLHPGDASGLVYRNDEMVHSPVELKADDVIEAGKTKLILVPFSSIKATW
jgi:Inner membrane component of T3SS, cytoplasmic domain